MLLTLPLLLAGCLLPGGTTVSGTLHGRIEWHGTVLIDGDVVVDADAVLTIAPGTQVLFLPPSTGRDRHIDHPHFPGSELIVKGRLLAEGTATAPIVFAHRDAAAAAGSWGGVNLVESPSTVFRYCFFRQADSAVHSQKSQVLVEACRFTGNLVAIRFHDSAIRIEHNSLYGNDTAIRFHGGAPVIRFNDLHDNDRGLFITAHPRDVTLTDNHLTGNRRFAVVLGEEVPEAIAMPGNWWGSEVAAVIETGFFDGRRVDYLGRIDYQPLAVKPIPEVGVPWNR